MTEYATLSKEDLCRLIHERVFETPVLGVATCVWVDGEVSVHPDVSPEGWACPAEVWPVCVETCMCEFAEEGEPRYFGHNSNCLQAVPDYLSWEGMGLLIERMKERGYDVSLNTYHKGTDIDPCHAAFFINRRVEPTDADAPDLPIAVAIAALKTTGEAGAPTTKQAPTD